MSNENQNQTLQKQGFKTLLVSQENHKILLQARLEGNFRCANDVVSMLIDSHNKLKKAEKLGKKKDE